MRVVVVLLSFLFVAQVAHAQTPAPTTQDAEVQLVKFSWSKERLNWEAKSFWWSNREFSPDAVSRAG